MNRRPSDRGSKSSSSSSTTKPASSSSSSSDEDAKRSHMISAEPTFKHTSRLLLATAPSILIIFAFGGRPSLIALCFGSLIAYILDLIGAVEGTVISIVVTLIGIWTTIVWAARFLLLDSLQNFIMLFVLGFILLYLFFIIAGSFRMLRLEFETIFYMAENLMFYTLPLLGASVTTWFLCVEIPSVDLPTCFSFCYGIYLMMLGTPLSSSLGIMAAPASVTTSTPRHLQFILSKEDIITMYFTPIVYAPILHIFVHHNVLRFDMTTFLSVLESAVFPALLVTLCAERQIDYWPLTEQDKTKKFLEYLKLILAGMMFFCVQRHPLFNDFKAFAGYGSATSSVLLIISCSMVCFAVIVNRLKRQLGILSEILINVCIAIAATLMGILLDLELDGLIIGTVGALSLAEFYRKSGMITTKNTSKDNDDYHEEDDTLSMKNSTTTNLKEMLSEFLVLVASFCVAVVVHMFVKKTLLSMNFYFKWGDKLYTIRDFCFLETLITAIAIASPPLANHQNIGVVHALGYVSGTAHSTELTENRRSTVAGMKSWLFFGAVQVISIIVAVIELMVREQDWQDHGVKPGQVYPAYLLAVTGGILVVTAFHLYSIGMLTVPSACFVGIVQVSKLAHLAGFNSNLVIAFIAVLLAYTSPFILHYSHSLNLEDKSRSVDDIDNIKFMLFVCYLMIGAFLGAFYGGHQIAPVILQMTLSKSANEMQVMALSLSSWFLFVAAIITVMWRKAAFLRSSLLLASGFLALVSTEALGPLTISYDRSSSTYLVVSLHPELAQGDHSGLFLLVTAFLVITAFLGLFPIHRPIPRILFALSFSYCAAHAVMGLAFPASMGADNPDNGAFDLPWVYSFVFCILSTSTALKAMAGIVSKKKTTVTESLTKNYVFIAWATAPLLALVWAVFEDSMREHALGIMWVATSQFALTAMSIRLRGIAAEFFPSKAQKESGEVATDVSTFVICSCAGIFSFAWGVLASLLSPHIASDLSIPFLSLLLLFTSSNIMLNDVAALKLVCLFASGWWFISAMYAILVKGLFQSVDQFDAFHLSKGGTVVGGLYGDGTVSIWLSQSIFTPILNLFLTMVPIPTIYLGSSNSKGKSLSSLQTSDDLIFVLSIACALTVIVSSLWSIRLLGLMGMFLGFIRSGEFNDSQQRSDRVI